MARKIDYDHVLPTRFRIRANALENFQVHTCKNSWFSDAKDILKSLRALEPAKSRRGDNEWPELRFLNQALLALSPMLVHGYEVVGKETQLLALDRYPGPSLISRLALQWSDIWIKKRFKELAPDILDEKVRILQEKIKAAQDDWRPVSALDALKEKDGLLRYPAIPSLFAAYMAQNGPSQIFGQTVPWRLLQGAKNQALRVVSEPRNIGHGSFAYLIRFSLQFQPGDEMPWLYVSLSCQRYMEKPIEKLNAGRPTLLVQLEQPLREDWPHTKGTLVRLPIYGGLEHPSLEDGLPELLQRVEARNLVAPSSIFQNPLHYRQKSQDNYLILYAEGYEPSHSLGSGFGAVERTAVFQQICERFAGLLEPASAMDRVEPKKWPATLLPWKIMEDRSIEQAPRHLSAEEQSDFKISTQQEFRLASLKRAAKGKRVHFLLLFNNPDMDKAMEGFLLRQFQLNNKSEWPEWIRVSAHPIPGELSLPLIVPGDFGDADWGKRRRQVEQRVAGKWLAFLQRLNILENEYNLAFIEIPATAKHISPYSAIRAACVKAGILSQMINPLRTNADMVLNIAMRRGDPPFDWKMQDFVRLYSGASDLALRQMGVTSKNLIEDVYITSGLKRDIAEKLSVIGLVRHRGNISPRLGKGGVDYPLAICIRPDGNVEARLPRFSMSDPESKWIPYQDAAIQIGRMFNDADRMQDIGFAGETNAKKSQGIQQFVLDVINSVKDAPSILMVHASDWRSVWPSTSVPKININRMNFDIAGSPIITPEKYPGLRAVWVRTYGGLGETPQYVATTQTNWDDLNEEGADRIWNTSLFLDREVGGSLEHLFSVGWLDNTGKKAAQDSAKILGEDADQYFRQQQLIEIVPWFSQPGDDPLSFGKTAHLLRSSPAWNTGNIILPYPIHLGLALLRDMLPLLGVDNMGDDGEDE